VLTGHTMGNAGSSEKESGELGDDFLSVTELPATSSSRRQRRTESVVSSSSNLNRTPQSRSSSISHPPPHALSSSSLRSPATQFRPPDNVALAPVLSTHTSTSSAYTMGQTQSRHGAAGGRAHTGSASPAKPVNIPDSGASRKSSHSHAHRQLGEGSFPIPPIGFLPSDEPNSYLIADPEYTRPPRLPLPVNNQKHVNEDPPDLSPLLPPTAEDDDVDLIPHIELKTDEGGVLKSVPSAVSSAAPDDEDIGDDLSTVRGGVLPSVPTVVEWLDHGSKVYVTGTFANWDRKYRLTRK
jgi:hypothetical protein